MGSGLVYPLLFYNFVRVLCYDLYPFGILHPGIPLVHLIAGAALTIAPSLRSGATAFLLFKALDYSLFSGRERDSLYPFVV